MVDRQVRTFDVTDQIVTTRMLEMPREMFLPDEHRALAYSDSTVILAGSEGPHARTMLPPFVIARMMQAAAPVPTDRVLDLAGGTGYTAALFAGLVADVVAVESDEALAGRAASNFAALGLANARSIAAPLASGGRGAEGFDIIFVNGCVTDGIPDLTGLLRENGRIVAIVPKPSGATMAALITVSGRGHSVRPLFDARAPVLPAFSREEAFVF